MAYSTALRARPLFSHHQAGQGLALAIWPPPPYSSPFPPVAAPESPNRKGASHTPALAVGA